ncbi:hypothetical protein [Pantoea stewartii]|uniref:hypothetical protein n=1 Tax=Pantoea stewartii TaxID=66269 RepID=UPI0016233200|nr:hypothetical protein [Pantoea stewartii]MBC0852579.1 hypothetical protein [Pantoea stewartii]
MSQMRKSEREALQNRQNYERDVKHVSEVSQKQNDFWNNRAQEQQQEADQRKKQRGY